MPFTKFHVPEGLSPEMCHLINREVHESLVQTCGSHEEDDFALVVRYNPADMMFHPTFLGTRDPDGTIVIEITLLGGRSDEQKEALFGDVRTRLDNIGFTAENSIMFLNENNTIDWSFGPEGSAKRVLGL